MTTGRTKQVVSPRLPCKQEQDKQARVVACAGRACAVNCAGLAKLGETAAMLAAALTRAPVGSACGCWEKIAEISDAVWQLAFPWLQKKSARAADYFQRTKFH